MITAATTAAEFRTGMDLPFIADSQRMFTLYCIKFTVQ
jgi:hypothetical protein